jgi:hypothetical protein
MNISPVIFPVSDFLGNHLSIKEPNATIYSTNTSETNYPVSLREPPLQNFEGELSHDAVWAAMSAGDADAVVRWDFCRLDFFVSFLIKQKRKIENTYPCGFAVTQVNPSGGAGFSTDNCPVKYNFFNQPTKITEISDSDTYELTLSYGANQQRKQTTLTRDDTVINTRYYVSKFFLYGFSCNGMILSVNF